MVTAATAPHTIIGRKIIGALTLALCVALLPVSATAQDDYPNRLIKVIVPFPAGTAVDVVTRMVADKLSARWGQAIIIENRLGATGNIGAAIAATADPDGYTLLASAPPPLAINQSLYPNLNFDAAAFVPVSLMTEVPNILVVNPAVPAKTLQELIALSKAKSDALTYGSTGPGGTPQLTMEMLKLMSGVKLRDIPYRRGVAPALIDLLAGHIDAMFVNTSDAIENVRSGKFRALAVTSRQRLPELPDVPTVAESYPGFNSTTWFAMMAPPKTPQVIADKLSAAIAEILKSPDVTKVLQERSFTVMAKSPDGTGKFIRTEIERWRDVIVKAGIKAE